MAVVDDERLSYLYRTYGPAIHARCHKLLGEASAADDATQETFVRVYRHLASVPEGPEGHRQAFTWIYRIATNLCLNELRDRKGRPEPVELLPETAGPDASDGLIQADLVRRLVAHVPAKLRAPAWLHHVEGMDQAEVARVLDLSRGTVINRLNDFQQRALKFLGRSA